jgi:anti-sigma B factor antagonist
MSFPIWREEGTTIVGIDGALDVSTREELEGLVLDAVERGERAFRLDFSRAGFVDSSGLGVLVSLNKKISERGGAVALAGLDDDLRHLLELTRLATLFRIEGGEGGVADLPARLRPRGPDTLHGAAEAPRPLDRPEA